LIDAWINFPAIFSSVGLGGIRSDLIFWSPLSDPGQNTCIAAKHEFLSQIQNRAVD
jgi:hypothetical protein